MSGTQLPLATGVNTVVICPDLKLRNTLIRAIEAMSESRIKPALKSDSESAQRAHYAPAISSLIINTASPDMHQTLGEHYVALAVAVADREAAAKRAVEVFEAAGFAARFFSQAEPEFPDGFLYFVVVPALKGIVLMCWPTPEAVTPDLIPLLPKREPWTPADLEITE